MQYILDIILAVVFVICVLAGYKKGFVKSLTDLVSHAIAIIAARILSIRFAPVIYSNYFEEGISEKISSQIESFGSGASSQIESTINNLPNISGFLQLVGVDQSQIAQSVSGQIKNEGVDLVSSLMTNLVSPVATFIVRILILILAFFVCLIVMKIISKLLEKLSKLPVLKQANKGFGLLFGAIKGLIIVAVVCALSLLIAGFVDSESLSNIVSDSYIVSAFSSIVGQINL